MPNNNSKKSFPLKSIQNRRCLTKCYPKGNVYLHPILLMPIEEIYNDSCAIDPVHSNDPHYYKPHNTIWSDTCRLDDNDKYSPPDELTSILLGYNFNPNDFLNSIYDIHSFDQAIYWTLENNEYPFYTIKRVHNCAWRVYGNNITEITSAVIDYYYDISKTYWLHDYANTIQNEYSFDVIKRDDNDKSKPTQELIYQILAEKFYSKDFFTETIKRYVYENENDWESIVSHYDNLKTYTFERLIKKIESRKSKNIK